MAIFAWPRDITPVPLNEWRERVEAAIAALPFLPTDGYSWDRYCAIQFFAQALTRYYPVRAFDYAEEKAILAPLIAWLAERSDSDVLAFVWELLTRRGDCSTSAIGSLNEMSRLRGSLDLQDLELAVSFAQDAEAMYSWPEDRWLLTEWKHASPPYLECVSHGNYVVRAWAAKALGQTCWGCLKYGKDVPFHDMMILILEQESRTPGVGGAFLNGLWWSCGSEDILPTDFDYHTWFLDALWTGCKEPDVPHVLTLEFYAHEFFYEDADAIRELLRMGRRYCAVLTATEEPGAIPKLLPLLEEMAASDDPGVSAAITEYLHKRTQHAGLDHVRP